MLLLTLDGILLLFITLGLGVFFKTGIEKLFRSRLEARLLELFLTGLVFSTIYDTEYRGKIIFRGARPAL